MPGLSIRQLQIFSLQQQIMDDVHQLTNALLENNVKDKPLESRQQVEVVFYLNLQLRAFGVGGMKWDALNIPNLPIY